MSDYKNYLLRAMGVSLKESKFDPKELAKGKEEEKSEHGMTDKKAELTAKQHLDEPGQAHYYSGMEKAKKAGMFKEKKLKEGLLSTAIRSPLLSPTAIATPVIGVAVRGSVTGGLPSGADQVGDISPSRLGGYEKVPVEPVNSKLVDKTPKNPEIASSSPINDNPSLQGGVTHPHQFQKNAGEEPQGVTGASTDSDNTLKLKSALPKGIDIDIAQEGSAEDHEDPSNMNSHVKKDLNETFARHKELMKEKLKIKESTCQCGNPDCTCGCKSGTTDECKSCGCGKPNTTHDMKENVGAKEPFATKWKMDPEKAGMVKVDEKKEGLVRLSEAFDRIGVLAGLQPVKEVVPVTEERVEYAQPFARMRGLANLGERRMMPDGTWIGEEKEEKPPAKEEPKDGDTKYTRKAQYYDPKTKTTRDVDWVKSPVKEARITTTERLQGIKQTLERKSKRGTLSDKEAKLYRHLNEALSRRGV